MRNASLYEIMLLSLKEKIRKLSLERKEGKSGEKGYLLNGGEDSDLVESVFFLFLREFLKENLMKEN